VCAVLCSQKVQTWSHTHTHVRMHTHTHTHTHTHIHIRTHTCTHAHTTANTHNHTQTTANTHTNTHTHPRTHTHIHTQLKHLIQGLLPIFTSFHPFLSPSSDSIIYRIIFYCNSCVFVIVRPAIDLSEWFSGQNRHS
jgi:hypothetical protein